MALQIDTSSPLRGFDQLARLVEAVRDAGANDESRSVEWKSSLDLARKPGCFHVARAILGLANRMPDVAALEFGGLGYVLVGVEPGKVHGVQSVDHGELHARVSPYVGHDGPVWTPIEVALDDERVLVVTVEAPSPGDPIHVLRKQAPPEGGGAHEGTVFVRRPAQTAPASAQEMAALQQRLMARSVAPDIEVSARSRRGEPLAWYDGGTLEDEATAWVTERYIKMKRAAERTDRQRNPEKYPQAPSEPVSIADLAMQRNPLEAIHRLGIRDLSSVSANLLSQPDERTLDEYLEELEEWRSSFHTTAADVFESRFASGGWGLIAFRVENRSDSNLEAVQVRVRFTFPDLRAEEASGLPEPIPRPPHPFGKSRKLRGFGAPPNLDFLNYVDVNTAPSRTWIEEGSVVVVFEEDHLYPHDHSDSDPVAFCLSARPEAGALRGTWELRARNLHGIRSGELALPIEDSPTAVTDVFERPAPDHDSPANRD